MRIRDDAGSTWCWQPDPATRKAVPTAGRCWTESDRPELLSVLLAANWPPRLRLAWGPENGCLAVWEFDPVAGQRRRLGEVIARSREPLPFWWAPTQIELSEPGKRWTMPATAPPDFMMRLLRQICGSDSCLLDQILGHRREGIAFAA